MTEQKATEPGGEQQSSGGLKWIAGAAGAVIGAIGLVLLLVIVSMFALVSSDDASQDNAGCTPPSRSDDGVTQESPDAPAEVKEEQIKNAKAIDQAAQDVGLSGKASEIAIITAMGESTLINVDYGDQDHGVTNADGSAATSFGLFQQQTSQGWGSKDEVMDPEHATKSFLLGPEHDGSRGLVSVNNWETREPTDVIHEVQGNADAQHYVASYSSARAIIAETDIDTSREADEEKMKAAGIGADDSGDKGGSSGSDVMAKTALNDDCSTTKTASWNGDLGDGEWTIPLPDSDKTSAGSFGPRNIAGYPAWANEHAGVDLATDMGSHGEGGPVVAPAEFEVTSLYTPDGCVYGRLTGSDDNPKFGMGFCHLAKIDVKEGDKLARGDVIGTEGNQGESLGNSQGGSGFITHLHFEMFPPETPDEDLAPATGAQIDPEPILREKGAWPDAKAAA